ncbi:MAG: hypothetical protein JXA30_20600 [Deltaproteobacteria bacterium]|nr:hypothetical protein [Deltaproteobacteria bacterium]
MRLARHDLFAVPTLSLLLGYMGLWLFACDAKDIALGKDPGKPSEQPYEKGEKNDGSTKDPSVGNAGGNGGNSGAGNEASGSPDIRDGSRNRDEERRIDGDGSIIVPPFQLIPCGFTFCLPGYVCCESCGICMSPGAVCPQTDCRDLMPDNSCDPRSCGIPPSAMSPVICPDGTMGGPLCIRMEDGSCAWQFVACVMPSSVPCGDSVNNPCGPFEYCDAPDCGRGTESGICQWRPSACPRKMDPVCGCDGREYGNPCLARAAGTEVDFRGSCRGSI